jgi:hypothetical protein
MTTKQGLPLSPVYISFNPGRKQLLIFYYLVIEFLVYRLIAAGGILAGQSSIGDMMDLSPL